MRALFALLFCSVSTLPLPVFANNLDFMGNSSQQIEEMKFDHRRLTAVLPVPLSELGNQTRSYDYFCPKPVQKYSAEIIVSDVYRPVLQARVDAAQNTFILNVQDVDQPMVFPIPPITDSYDQALYDAYMNPPNPKAMRVHFWLYKTTIVRAVLHSPLPASKMMPPSLAYACGHSSAIAGDVRDLVGQSILDELNAKYGGMMNRKGHSGH